VAGLSRRRRLRKNQTFLKHKSNTGQSLAAARGASSARQGKAVVDPIAPYPPCICRAYNARTGEFREQKSIQPASASAHDVTASRLVDAVTHGLSAEMNPKVARTRVAAE
jgi:hypothetical protein